MKTWLLAALVATGIGTTTTHEVLVLHSAPTLIKRTPGYGSFEYCNARGPNTVDCALGAPMGDGGSPIYDDGGLATVVGKARSVVAGQCWPVTDYSGLQLWCIAAVADQVSGAASSFSEAP